jgi:uroporphyrinogen III methyltransferase/synthase
MTATQKGKVYLVGAGPGDIGLLTVKGLRCLQAADVVIYDFHINPQVLNYVRRDAEFVYAGKRGGRHEMTQEQINRLMLTRAHEGKKVCRLKGGDPFVFGRGGEEAEVLAQAGTPFEIIPGVSSAVAVPAYAGIPLTHRGHSSSFAVITGNEAAAKSESRLYWEGLARNHDTLVFLMGVKNIDTICARLMEHGRPASTPAALIRWGTRPEQQTVTGTLDAIPSAVRDRSIRPPAILVVGEVVKLREALEWYEKKPLFGHRVLITRPYTEEYRRLEDLGAEVFEFPTLRIVPPETFAELDAAIGRIGDYDWLVITSANAFDFFMQRLIEGGRDVRDLKGIGICAIGARTAGVMARYGIRPDLVPDEFNAEGLVKTFIQRIGRDDFSRLTILLPRQDKARDVFPRKVRELGGTIDTPVAYRVEKPRKHGKRLRRFMAEGRISLATFTSGATFTNFVDMLGQEALTLLGQVPIAVIGPVTKQTVEKTGLKVAIMPPEATVSAMVDAIIDFVRKGDASSPADGV